VGVYDYMKEGFISRPSTLNDYRERGGSLLGQERLIATFPTTYTLVLAGELERIIVTNIQVTNTTLTGGLGVSIFHKPSGVALNGSQAIWNVTPLVSWVTYSHILGGNIYLGPGSSLVASCSIANLASVSVYGVRLNASL